MHFIETFCIGLKPPALGLPHRFISGIFPWTDPKFLDWLHHLWAAVTLAFPGEIFG
jgi:hypothetical protein